MAHFDSPRSKIYKKKIEKYKFQVKQKNKSSKMTLINIIVGTDTEFLRLQRPNLQLGAFMAAQRIYRTGNPFLSSMGGRKKRRKPNILNTRHQISRFQRCTNPFIKTHYSRMHRINLHGNHIVYVIHVNIIKLKPCVYEYIFFALRTECKQKKKKK